MRREREKRLDKSFQRKEVISRGVTTWDKIGSRFFGYVLSLQKSTSPVRISSCLLSHIIELNSHKIPAWIIWGRALQENLKMLCPNYIQDLLVSMFSEHPGCEKVLPEIITTLDATVQKSSFSHCRSWRQNQAMPGWNGIKREGKRERERIIVCSFFGDWSATADLAHIYWAYSEVIVTAAPASSFPIVLHSCWGFTCLWRTQSDPSVWRQWKPESTNLMIRERGCWDKSFFAIFPISTPGVKGPF